MNLRTTTLWTLTNYKVTRRIQDQGPMYSTSLVINLIIKHKMVDKEKVQKTHSEVKTGNLSLNICEISLKRRLSVSGRAWKENREKKKLVFCQNGNFVVIQHCWFWNLTLERSLLNFKKKILKKKFQLLPKENYVCE